MTISRDQEAQKGAILLVTRDPEFQLSVNNILQKTGYTINSTESVGRGIKEIVNSLSPRLVIIDMMPLDTAIKIAMRIHRWASARTLLLAFPGGGQNSVRKLDMDAPGYMSSPISNDEFTGWVEDLIERYSGDN